MAALSAPGTRPSSSPFAGVNPTFVRYELRRRFNRQTTIFTVLLPAVLYLALFRTSPNNATLPHGNFAAWMMIGLAVYGAATAAVSSAATISVEKSVGWMRTIALSPLTPPGYLLVKVACSVLMAGVPVAIVGVLGVATGAHADAGVWVTSLLVAWFGAAVFAALGIGMGLALKPDVVMHMPGLTMTALAFLGNLFIPLSGTMLEVSRFTPMYGVATLARYPLTDGYSFSGEHSSVAGAVFNLVAWFAGFSFMAIRRFSRSTGRQ
ncbi:ABC transporter permease [Streptomyces sp. CB01881]|uniref:ABC transporter permease n=1 Tax=Streptomyces sp. CB01881 TaxID=2078691 RepID=UPI000CDC314E|nr:ABC transporter permease [Streptomyces sp. CB01881]AUY50620.1 ABC transporter [Streptomyces sp. CB01881]TYC74006.1 ABC transporter permease [Streptomyces sp. CB01881]